MKLIEKKGYKYLFGILVGIPICMITVILIGDFILAEPNSFLNIETVSLEHGISVYDPQTIISDISNGKMDVFSEIEDDADINIPPEDNAPNNTFSDEELYQIAQHFFQSKWDDNPEDWRLVRVYYRFYDCKKGLDGIVSVSFVYEKLVFVGEKKNVNVRSMGITTWKNQIVWGDRIEDRTALSTKANWEAMNYHAMAVFEIAENNYDHEVYQEIENKCGYIVIAIYGNSKRWNVNYYDNDMGFGLYKLEVNSRTGKIKNQEISCCTEIR